MNFVEILNEFISKLEETYADINPVIDITLSNGVFNQILNQIHKDGYFITLNALEDVDELTFCGKIKIRKK